MAKIKTQEHRAPALEISDYVRLKRAIPEASDSDLRVLLGLGVEQTEVQENESTQEGKAEKNKPFKKDLQPKESTIRKSVYPPKIKEHPFPYISARKSKQPATDKDLPDQYYRAKPFSDEKNFPIVGEEIFPVPLTSWEEIWPWLHDIFRDEKTTKKLDTGKIIKESVKQRPLTVIPWQKKMHWPAELVVVVDCSAHLSPFFNDFRLIAGNLAAWFRERLKLVFCLDGEFQYYSYENKRYEVFPIEQEKCNFLFLSDLGCLDQGRISSWCWLELGEELAARQSRLDALVPAHPRDWFRPHGNLFSMHHWDRGRLQHRNNGYGAEFRQSSSDLSKQQCEELLACLSLAVEITPAMVRHLRQYFDFDVSVESLLFQNRALKGNFHSFQWRSEDSRQDYLGKLNRLDYSQENLWQELLRFESRLVIELQIEQRQKAGKKFSKSQSDFIYRLVKTSQQSGKDSALVEQVLQWVGRVASRAGDEEWDREMSELYGLYYHKNKPSEIPCKVDLDSLVLSLKEGTTRRQTILVAHRDGLKILHGSDYNVSGRVVANLDTDAQSSLAVKKGSRTTNYPVHNNDHISLQGAHEVRIETWKETTTLSFMSCPSWANGIGRDEYGLFSEVNVAGVSFILRWIPPGEFVMGSPDDEPERWANEGPQRTVDIGEGFWLAETACSQELWQAVMGGNPSRFQDEPDHLTHPVENVSWQKAQDFIRAVNNLAPGLDLRLPSEAEWEYACRASTTTPFWFGHELSVDDANYDGNYPYNNGPKGEYRNKTVPIKFFRRNPWGLYQMHGNVWEWCQDRWHENYEGAPKNASPWEDGKSEYRASRGGSWIDNGRSLRSASRGYWARAAGSDGFRLARGPQAGKETKG